MPERIKKRCKACGEMKLVGDFYVNKAMKDGLMSVCKVCHSLKSAAYYQANLERMRKVGREKARKLRSEGKVQERERWSKLQKKYGISREEYEALLEEQHGGCAVCGSSDSGRREFFDVDHCHETGIVRGLLCSRCNQGLGYFKDDPDRLERAAAYLRAIVLPSKSHPRRGSGSSTGSGVM